jgi:hypothetical protein
MNHGLAWTHLVEAIKTSERQDNLNDDLIGAELAARQNRVGFGQSIIGHVRHGFAAIRARLAKRPETLEESLMRLANVSPHLLDDIGITASGELPVIEEVHAGRGLVRSQLVETKVEAEKVAPVAPKPVAVVELPVGRQFGGLAAAE